MAYESLDLRFVEVDGTWQEAGPLRFRAVEVDARPLPALLRLPVRPRRRQVVAYSGDTTPCAGLSELAREADVLVVECNGRHAPPGVPPAHMDEESIRALQAGPPRRPPGPDPPGRAGRPGLDCSGVTVPDDFERLTV